MIVLQADKLANMPVLNREHVGESMLPSMRQYLRFIDLENEYDIRGFIHKVAYATSIKRYYQLKLSSQFRAEADELMLRHAARQGVRVFEEVCVDSIEFASGESMSLRPITANWKSKLGKPGYLIRLADRCLRSPRPYGHEIPQESYLPRRPEKCRSVRILGKCPVEDDGSHQNATWIECLTDKRAGHGTYLSTMARPRLALSCIKTRLIRRRLMEPRDLGSLPGPGQTSTRCPQTSGERRDLHHWERKKHCRL
ncbi:Flavin-dependent halogenase armH [Salix suchowensis]|nr:Flavin-dependent halogenase armH [Salix suchowensis]